MGSKIVKNHKNDPEMPYKYISEYLWPLGSGLEAFLYDFQKSIFDYLAEFLSDLDETGVKYH